MRRRPGSEDDRRSSDGRTPLRSDDRGRSRRPGSRRGTPAAARCGRGRGGRGRRTSGSGTSSPGGRNTWSPRTAGRGPRRPRPSRGRGSVSDGPESPRGRWRGPRCRAPRGARAPTSRSRRRRRSASPRSAGSRGGAILPWPAPGEHGDEDDGVDPDHGPRARCVRGHRRGHEQRQDRIDGEQVARALLDAQPHQDDEDEHPGQHRSIGLAIRREAPPHGDRDQPQCPRQELTEAVGEGDGRGGPVTVEVPDHGVTRADGLAARVLRRQGIGDCPRQRRQRHEAQARPRAQRGQPPDGPRGEAGRDGCRDHHEGREPLRPERAGDADVEARQMGGTGRQGTQPAQEEVERPGQPRGEHHVGQDLVAEEEEARTGGQHDERDESGVGPGEAPPDGEHAEQCRQRRGDRGDRGLAIRHAPGGPGAQRNGPEEQWRLVEVRRIAHSGRQSEPVAKRVLREQDHSSLVLVPERASADGHRVHDRGRAQQGHEQCPLTGRQPFERLRQPGVPLLHGSSAFSILGRWGSYSFWPLLGRPRARASFPSRW